MIDKLQDWMNELNSSHIKVRQPCTIFENHFGGFYSSNYLRSAFFVITDELPKPDFPELRDAGLGGFIDDDFDGITYQDTYYIKKECANVLWLHFHELVHVV